MKINGHHDIRSLTASPVTSAVMAAGDEAGGVLNIFVFGQIGHWWGINKNEVLLKLKGRKYQMVNLVISSNGGDLAEALVIRDLLKAYPASVNAYLTGLCASAATILADAADKVVMSRNCMYMIHKPAFEYTGGNADELRNDADLLDKWEEIAVGIYVSKTGLPKNEVAALLKEESWLGWNEALSLGFVDEVVDTLDIDYDLDTAGAGHQDMFISEPIYFNNTKEIFTQAVQNAIKGGYKQLSPARMQALKPSNHNNSDMKKLLESIVGMLVTAGIITADNQAKAVEAIAGIETPDMLKGMVQEEVAKQRTPAMKASDVLAALESATDDEKTALKEAFGINAAGGGDEDDFLKKQVEELAGQVAALMVGEGGATGDNNGGSGFDKKDKKELTFKEKEAIKMYKAAYEEGQIDAATYKALTGQEAKGKRNRVEAN